MHIFTYQNEENSTGSVFSEIWRWGDAVTSNPVKLFYMLWPLISEIPFSDILYSANSLQMCNTSILDSSCFIYSCWQIKQYHGLQHLLKVLISLKISSTSRRKMRPVRRMSVSMRYNARSMPCVGEDEVDALSTGLWADNNLKREYARKTLITEDLEEFIN